MRLSILFISTLLLVVSCKKEVRIDTTGYAPWESVSNEHTFHSGFSRKYMDSRPPRIVEELNRDWTFFYSPSFKENPEYTLPEYDDNEWEAIRLPHTWMTYETTGELHPFIMNASENEDSYWWKGWGYYRKKIMLEKSLKDKRFFLEFDGVQKHSIIYVNGEKAGEHKGGFNSFSIEITPFIDWSRKEQNIAVCVNGYRRDKWNIPPMTAGNWNVYSGIYRPVRLVLKNDIYIPYQGNAWHEGGTFVTTPYVKDNNAIVQVVTYVKNDTQKPEEVLLKTLVVNNNDSVLAELLDKKTIQQGEISCFVGKTPLLENIQYWSDKTPVLYKVKSLVYHSDTLVDCYESPLGIRTFRWDYEKNDLYVNGIKTNIRGTNRHQEYPWLGDAIPEWIMLNDMMDIRYGLGFNFMRTAHYPQSPFIYDFNNQHGIITVEEVPNIKNIKFDEEVQEQNARAMVRRDRNNPSIFFWSVGNETNDAADSRWIMEEDTTRIIHARKAEGGGKYVRHTHVNLDMENLLRVTHRGWFCNEDVKTAIQLDPDNGQEAGSNLWQYEKAKMRNGSIRGDLNHNCVTWLYQDHGADRNYKNSLLTAVNAKGWVDAYRIPKYVYFLTQANYREEPFLYLNPVYWRHKFIGQYKDIYIDSNCEEVELFINKKSMGRKKISHDKFNSVKYDNILIEPGDIKAIGYNDGKIVSSRVVKMPREPQRIILKTSSDKLNQENEKIAVITAYIVDKDGVIVYDVAPPLKWEISGKAKLAGPSLYENDLNKIESRTGTGYDAIPVSNVIRGESEAGKVKIKVSSPGLKTGEVMLFNENDEISALIVQPALSSNGRRKNVRNHNYKESNHFSNIIKTKLYSNTTFYQTDNEKLRTEINDFLQHKEDAQNLHGLGYDELLNQLVLIVKRMDGLLIGDDFNFLMQQYNMYLNIEQIIDECVFHVDYSDLLKKEYRNKIMVTHEQVDFFQECDEIKSYPKKHKICYVKFDENAGETGNLMYDYVTRTYTVKIKKENFPDTVLNLFKVQGNRSEKLKEIARITPSVVFNKERHVVEFKNEEQILIIPEELN